MVDEVVYKLRDYYPENQMPSTRFYARGDAAISIYSQADANPPHHNRFTRYYPSTSISKIVGSFLSAPDSSHDQYNMDMRITEHTGWRTYTNSYHSGIDFNVQVPGQTDGDLFAPEDGYFYFTDYRDQNGNQRWYLNSFAIDPDTRINIAEPVGDLGNGYRYWTYGIIGVFISDGDNETKRIYIITHQGSNSICSDTGEDGQIIGEDPNTVAPAINASFLELRDQFEEVSQYRSYSVFPRGANNMVRVKKGDWIGKISNNGGGPSNANWAAHGHLEIYEYFEFTVEGAPIDWKIQKDRRWRVINPLTVFNSESYTYNENFECSTIPIQNEFIQELFEAQNEFDTIESATQESLNFFQVNSY